MYIIIKRVEEQDIAGCVKVIKESFATVAKEFGFTVENAPGFTIFATTGSHYFDCFIARKAIKIMVSYL